MAAFLTIYATFLCKTYEINENINFLKIGANDSSTPQRERDDAS